MRRLPVYLVIDTSATMRGKPIEAVKNGLQIFIDALKQYSYAMEAAFLSIITFDSIAQQIVPLTELVSFSIPVFKTGGNVSMGAALKLVANKINVDVRQSALVFILTNSEPTDDWQTGIAEFDKCQKRWVCVYPLGKTANKSILKQIKRSSIIELSNLDSIGESIFEQFRQIIITGTEINNG